MNCSAQVGVQHGHYQRSIFDGAGRPGQVEDVRRVRISRMAVLTASLSVISTDKCVYSALAILGVVRASPNVRTPSASNASQRCEPRNPLAPVTRATRPSHPFPNSARQLIAERSARASSTIEANRRLRKKSGSITTLRDVDQAGVNAILTSDNTLGVDPLSSDMSSGNSQATGRLRPRRLRQVGAALNLQSARLATSGCAGRQYRGRNGIHR